MIGSGLGTTMSQLQYLFAELDLYGLTLRSRVRFYWRHHSRRCLVRSDMCESWGWLGGNGWVQDLLDHLARLNILIRIVVIIARVIRRGVLRVL